MFVVFPMVLSFRFFYNMILIIYNMYICIYTYLPDCLPACIHTYTHTIIHTYTHTHIHTYTHTHIPTYTHIHT